MTQNDTFTDDILDSAIQSLLDGQAAPRTPAPGDGDDLAMLLDVARRLEPLRETPEPDSVALAGGRLRMLASAAALREKRRGGVFGGLSALVGGLGQRGWGRIASPPPPGLRPGGAALLLGDRWRRCTGSFRRQPAGQPALPGQAGGRAGRDHHGPGRGQQAGAAAPDRGAATPREALMEERERRDPRATRVPGSGPTATAARPLPGSLPTSTRQLPPAEPQKPGRTPEPDRTKERDREETPAPTATGTPHPSETRKPEETPDKGRTPSPEPTRTPRHDLSPTPSATPTSGSTPRPTRTPESEHTPTATATPTITPSQTPVETGTPGPTGTATPTPSPYATATRTREPDSD